jgi:uncharacterized protein
MSLDHLSSSTLAESRRRGEFATHSSIRMSSAAEFWDRYARALMARDFERWGDLWAEDATFTVAYPLPGMPATMEGRDAIVSGIRSLAHRVMAITLSDVQVHETRTPGVFFVQYAQRVDLASDLPPYHNTICSKVIVRDGQIIELVEYYDVERYARFVGSLGLT